MVIEKLLKALYAKNNKREPHIIKVEDYENDETPFVVEVKNTGIKVA